MALTTTIIHNDCCCNLVQNVSQKNDLPDLLGKENKAMLKEAVLARMVCLAGPVFCFSAVIVAI